MVRHLTCGRTGAAMLASVGLCLLEPLRPVFRNKPEPQRRGQDQNCPAGKVR